MKPGFRIRSTQATISSMNRKTVLSLMTALLAAAGLALTAVPFIGSLGVSAKAENSAWGACDLSDLQPGKLRVCGYAWVYRRTEKDKSEVGKFTDSLQDPDSLASNQPHNARNIWRSENPDYFVFRPWAPEGSCILILRDAGEDSDWLPADEAKAASSLPYFFDPCDGRIWDTSGRLYARRGHPPENNLIVPKVRWVSETEVLIYGAML